MKDHYETLGVGKDASPADIAKAFKRLASRHHPDREGGSAEMMAAVNVAYQVLSDRSRRQDYDSTGQDTPRSTMESRADDKLLALFDTALGQVDERADPFEWMRAQLFAEVKQLDQLVATASKQITKRERALKRVTKKGSGRNIFVPLLEEQVQNIRETVERMGKQRLLTLMASARIDDYRWMASDTAEASAARLAGKPAPLVPYMY